MHLARRRVLFGLGGAAAAVCAPGIFGNALAAEADIAAPAGASYGRVLAPRAPVSPADVRRVQLHNLHTGDKLDAVYFEKGGYVTDALAEAMRVLRDWRNGQEHAMDPRLFDVMHGIAGKLEATAPFQIISGYRSPATNAMLHARSEGVASHSQHMLGKASDIRIQGVALTDLRKAAMSLNAGGVGFYPVSNFVHVDVGPVRQWSGT